MVESNLDVDGEGKSRCLSTFRKTVMLKDWWLIKCTNEFEGKRFGVAGIEIMASAERRAVRVFTSSPIIKAFDVFTLETSDGNCIIIRGFLNKERVVQSGFSPEISRHFVFGFPPCWEQICNDCFEGRDINTENLKINKAYCSVLSPCKSKKTNIEETPSQKKDKSTVSEPKTSEFNGQDGRSDGSRTGDKQIVGRKSQLLQSKASGVKNPTTNGDHSSEGFKESKRGDEEKHESVVIENDVTSPVCTDSVPKVTSKKVTRESTPSSEQQKSKRKATSAFPCALLKDLDKRSKSRKKGKSSLKSGINVVNAEENLSMGKTKRKIAFDMEVTPVKEAKKQDNNMVSPESVGQRRSRSGRVLVSSLEFWRNQIPVYDMDRKLIRVQEGHDVTTPSKGRGT